MCAFMCLCVRVCIYVGLGGSHIPVCLGAAANPHVFVSVSSICGMCPRAHLVHGWVVCLIVPGSSHGSPCSGALQNGGVGRVGFGLLASL